MLTSDEEAQLRTLLSNYGQILNAAKIPLFGSNTLTYLRNDKTWSDPNSFLWDQTISGSAVTDVTSPTLDINTDKAYQFEFILKNPAGGTARYQLFVNGDTTTTNYWYISDVYTTVAGGSTGNSPDILETSIPASSWIIINGFITISPDGYVVAQGFGYELTSAQAKAMGGAWNMNYTQTVANLTSLTIHSTTASRIGINSRLRIKRIG